MITLTGISKEFGSQALFEDVNLQLNPGCRYGVVGANGSGKSTFLRILTGEEEASSGKVAMPKKLSIGVLRQDHYRYDEDPIIQVTMMGHAGLWEAMVEKERIVQTEPFDSEAYGELEDFILSQDGYSFEARCGEILEGLGIPSAVHQQPLSTLSGGFKLRVLLAQTLAADPAVLLLDEPTNHLDILSIRWLENFLSGYRGCAVVVSHDHRFLNTVCTHILDVDYQRVTLYAGNYTRFEKAKEEARQRKEAEIAKREKEIAHHLAFAERFRAKATKARQAQSKLRQIDRIDLSTLPPSSRRYPKFSFKQKRPSGKTVLEIEKLRKAYGDHLVLDNINVVIRRGDHLAIIGPNGIGKSTLLKILVGRVPADSGEIRWGHETHPGYFAQDHREILDGKAGTVEAFLGAACPGRDTGWVRGRLGRVLFSKEEVKKKITALSGGEAARLIFARLSVEEPNVLILDEPTNHLDLEAIEALAKALREYDGTLIFVSHDRWFVSKLARRIIEITEDGIRDFDGSYEEYLEKEGMDHLDAAAVEQRKKPRRPERKKKSGNHENKQQKARNLHHIRLEIESLENAIEAAQKRVDEIDADFCLPGFFETHPGEVIGSMRNEREARKAEIERLSAEWEEKMGMLE